MATSVDTDTAGLLVHSDKSSDDSYEHIDPVFDEAFNQELTGTANADYIPMERGEIFLRKGSFLAELC